MKQRTNHKCFVKLEKTITEGYTMLKPVCVYECLLRTHVFERLKRFIEGPKNDQRSFMIGHFYIMIFDRCEPCARDSLKMWGVFLWNYNLISLFCEPWENFHWCLCYWKKMSRDWGLSRILIFEWFWKFKEGRETTKNNTCSIRPYTSKVDVNVQTISSNDQ